jgi:VanZ family protein
MTPPPLSDSPTVATTAADGRPDFIVRLGLLLPCSAEDVEAAFRIRAKEVHPDHGGSIADFVQLEADRRAALEYSRFFTSRRAWLAANVERYALQQDFISRIEQCGGKVETDRPEWIARQIGDDFAQMIDVITAVHWTGLDVGLDDVRFLVAHRELLGNLHRLDLSDTLVGYPAIKLLAALPTLHELNLRGSYAGNRAASALTQFPALRRVDLADTFVTWRGVWNLRRRRRDIEVIADSKLVGGLSSKSGYRWAFRLLLLYIVALVVATHMPDDHDFLPETNVRNLDKLAHFSIYCGLATLTGLVVAWRTTHRRRTTRLAAWHYLAIAFSLALFGALDELTQPWTGRDRDLRDWFADVAGIITGLVLFAIIMIVRRRVKSRHDDHPQLATA